MTKQILKNVYNLLPAFIKQWINIIRRQLPAFIKQWINIILKQLKNYKILSCYYGQYTTIKEWSCLDAEGKPICWYTYPALEYLDHMNFASLKVFEFGSGNSSLWWLNKAKSVVSIEDDQEWYKKISGQVKKSASLKFRYILADDKNKYITSFDETHADIVIVDGKHRKECSEHLVSLQKNGKWEGCMLIFDNSDWYPETVSMLRQSLGWVQADFHGFGPINNYTWTTTMFLNPENYHNLSYDRHLNSVAGTGYNAEKP